jgi:hypothetical protein
LFVASRRQRQPPCRCQPRHQQPPYLRPLLPLNLHRRLPTFLSIRVAYRTITARVCLISSTIQAHSVRRHDGFAFENWRSSDGLKRSRIIPFRDSFSNRSKRYWPIGRRNRRSGAGGGPTKGKSRKFAGLAPTLHSTVARCAYVRREAPSYKATMQVSAPRATRHIGVYAT